MLAEALAALTISGVHGIALIDPARPVCIVGQPCSAPDAHDVLAFWRSGRRVATATTGADGSFRVRLAPGSYRITLPKHAQLSRLTPQIVRISRGRDARVVLRIDVGIR